MIKPMKKPEKRRTPQEPIAAKPFPRPNVEFAYSGDPSDVTADKMRSLICNPIYAGIGQFPALVDEETWVRAATQMIQKEGAEQFLVNMLHVLRLSWKTITPESE
jgi:hypothetical protein